jgi:hypothetical protein
MCDVDIDSFRNLGILREKPLKPLKPLTHVSEATKTFEKSH